jgi:hypothetical protein
MAPMLKVFECHLAPGADRNTILSAETLRETQAQVMSIAEAKAVGFGGMPEPPPGKEMCLIAVAARDAKWVQRALESSDAVTAFNVHDVG